MLTLLHTPTAVGNVFNLHLEISSASVLPLELFLFRRDLSGNDVFSAIASPDDISKYPPTEPAAGVPFFRKKEADREFSTTTELSEYLGTVKSELEQLDWTV